MLRSKFAKKAAKKTKNPALCRGQTAMWKGNENFQLTDITSLGNFRFLFRIPLLSPKDIAFPQVNNLTVKRKIQTSHCSKILQTERLYREMNKASFFILEKVALDCFVCQNFKQKILIAITFLVFIIGKQFTDNLNKFIKIIFLKRKQQLILTECLK